MTVLSLSGGGEGNGVVVTGVGMLDCGLVAVLCLVVFDDDGGGGGGHVMVVLILEVVDGGEWVDGGGEVVDGGSDIGGGGGEVVDGGEDLVVKGNLVFNLFFQKILST